MSWRRWSAVPARCGSRSMTSITRWNRSRSFSMTMSNGVVVVPSAVRQAMDHPRIAVVREHDGTVDREQRVELLVREPVRMLRVGLESHQVDDVHDTDLQIG